MAQGVHDALTFDSSQGRGEESEVEAPPRRLDLCGARHRERHDPLELDGRCSARAVDALGIGIDRQDGLGGPRVPERHSSVAAAELEDAEAVEARESRQRPDLGALGIDAPGQAGIMPATHSSNRYRRRNGSPDPHTIPDVQGRQAAKQDPVERSALASGVSPGGTPRYAPSYSLRAEGFPRVRTLLLLGRGAVDLGASGRPLRVAVKEGRHPCRATKKRLLGRDHDDVGIRREQFDDTIRVERREPRAEALEELEQVRHGLLSSTRAVGSPRPVVDDLRATRRRRACRVPQKRRHVRRRGAAKRSCKRRL